MRQAVIAVLFVVASSTCKSKGSDDKKPPPPRETAGDGKPAQTEPSRPAKRPATDPGAQDIVFSVGGTGVVGRGLTEGIYTVGRDGSHVFPVTKDWKRPKDTFPGYLEPTFSPDGAHILFSVVPSSVGTVPLQFVVPSAGGQPKQIGKARSACWMDAGRVLIFDAAVENQTVVGKFSIFDIASGSATAAPSITGADVTCGAGGFLTRGGDTGEFRYVSYRLDGSPVASAVLDFNSESVALTDSLTAAVAFVGRSEYRAIDLSTGRVDLLHRGADGALSNVLSAGARRRAYPRPKTDEVVFPMMGPKRERGKAVYMHRVSGGAPERLTATWDGEAVKVYVESDLAWAPDGSEAVVEIRGVESGLYLVKPGQVPRLLVAGGRTPDWKR